MKDLYYLSDSFTLEFECYLENVTSKIDVDFYASSKEEVFKLIFHTIIKKEKKGYFLEYERWFSSNQKERKKLPADFVYNTWHRIAISYINNKLSYYLDESKLLAIPGHDHALTGLLFSFSSAAALRNVRLASGKKRELEPPIQRIAAVPLHPIPVNAGPRSENPLNKILTENKFITHAINFNVNESTIRPESMDFISKLTEFLMANPSVRLEIIGHTDNDGDSTSNIKLSLARANEVKKQLTDRGIENTRLNTNGYGASRPLKSNDTPEGKAENRRVEFIRQ